MEYPCGGARVESVPRSPQYSITVTASDGKYEATRKVRIDVMNVNDVAPVFDRPGYELGLREGYISPDPIIKVSRREATSHRIPSSR